MVRRLIITVIGSVLALSVMSCEEQHVCATSTRPLARSELLGRLVRPLSRRNPRAQPIASRNRLSGFAVNYDGKQGEELASQAAP